jgi:hypothetical protein
MPRMVQISARPLNNNNSCEVLATGFMGENTMILPLSLGALQQGIEKWDAGAYVQDAFPTLNAGQREFLMTGLLPREFNKMFAGDPEDN